MEGDGEGSGAIRGRVFAARTVQEKSFKGRTFHANAQMGTRVIKKFCEIDDGTKDLLERAVEKFGLSPRAYHRILKVSRTIADLYGKERIEQQHVAEAIQYRVLDKRSSL